jgi:hypothetical protein
VCTGVTLHLLVCTGPAECVGLGPASCADRPVHPAAASTATPSAAARISPRMLYIFTSPQWMAGLPGCPGVVSCFRLAGSGSSWVVSALPLPGAGCASCAACDEEIAQLRAQLAERWRPRRSRYVAAYRTFPSGGGALAVRVEEGLRMCDEIVVRHGSSSIVTG